MSKSKAKKKRVVVAKDKSSATKVSPTTSRRSRTSAKSISHEKMLFKKNNFNLMMIGAGLVLVGMLMMIGGSMPDVNTWDPDIIYSTRITVIGPILIVAGLIVEVYAIFKK